jgi:hypothetical protein
MLPTRVAHAGWDEHRYFGHRVFADLAGKESFTGLLAMAVTGRRLSPEACAVLDDISAVLTVADARIWPLKLTRVISAYGRTIPAFAAGYLSLEGATVGHWLCGRAAEHLLEFAALIGARIDDEDTVREAVRTLLARERNLVGFGVPFRAVDERVVALRACMARRGRERLPYWSLLEASSAVMQRERQLPPNMCFGVAAACLDLGLTPPEIAAMATALAQNAFLAHAVEGARQAPAVLRTLPVERMRYAGAPPRTSPRALARESEAPEQ